MIKEKSNAWAAFSRQLGFIFAKLPFPPNTYTWLTVPVTFAGLLAIVYQHIGLGIWLFLLSGVLDLIDGAVARQTNRTSFSGAFLDGTIDRFIDFFVIFSFFWLSITTPFFAKGQWICITVFLAIMPSFVVAYANHRRAVDDPEEKLIWRILNRGEMYFLMLLVIFVSRFNSAWAGYLLLVLVTLSFITTLQTLFLTMRLSKSRQETKSNSQ